MRPFQHVPLRQAQSLLTAPFIQGCSCILGSPHAGEERRDFAGQLLGLFR
jgi:hypothetical protein